MEKNELIIDTNVIYYLTGVGTISGIDIQKLKQELGNYVILISQWSIIEILTNDEIDMEKKEMLLKYIADTKIKVLPINGSNIFKTYIPTDLSYFIYGDEKEMLIEKIKKEKINQESNLLEFCIRSVAGVYSIALYHLMENQKSGTEKNKVIGLAMHMLIGNENFIHEKTLEIVTKLYYDKRETEFKENLLQLIAVLMYIVVAGFEGAKKGYLFDIIPEENRQLTMGEIKNLYDDVGASPLASDILKILNKGILKNITKKVGKENIELALQEYRMEFINRIPLGIREFYIDIIKKLFDEGARITKNDMIDAQLLQYYPEKMVLSFDGRFSKIVGDFDKDFLAVTEEIKKKCSIP
jgi:hypothetical protein